MSPVHHTSPVEEVDVWNVLGVFWEQIWFGVHAVQDGVHRRPWDKEKRETVNSCRSRGHAFQFVEHRTNKSVGEADGLRGDGHPEAAAVRRDDGGLADEAVHRVDERRRVALVVLARHVGDVIRADGRSLPLQHGKRRGNDLPVAMVTPNVVPMQLYQAGAASIHVNKLDFF